MEKMTPEEELAKASEDQLAEEQEPDGSTLPPKVNGDAEPVKENPAQNAELVDENGVPWKNRAKELERKYLKALEEKNAPKTEAPVMSKEEVYQKIADEFNISLDEVPGIIALTNSIIAERLAKYDDKLSKYELKERKDTAKQVIAAKYDDFAQLSKDVDNELDKLPASVIGSDEQLGIEVEKAYWAAKGKRLAEQSKSAEEKARAKVEQGRKIISSQPDRGHQSPQEPATKATAAEREAAENMGISIEEYLESKSAVKNGRRRVSL